MIEKRLKIFSLIVICLTCYLVGICWTILPSISNTLITSNIYNLNENSYAILSSCLTIAATIFAGIAGLLGKKWNLKKVIILGSIISILGLFFHFSCYYYPSNTFHILFIGQCLLGIGFSSILASLTVYLCILFPTLSAMALTGIFTCINLGSVTGPTFFNLSIFEKWELNILIIAISWSILFIISFFALTSVTRPSSKNKQNQGVFKKKFILFWLFLFVLILYSICEYTYAFWGPVFLKQEKNISINLARYALAIFWFSVAFGQISICWLLKYLSPKYFYRILPILITSGFVILFFAKTYNNNVLGFIMGGLGSSAFVALTLSYVERTFKEVAEVTTGIMFMGYFVGYLVGSIFIGQLLKLESLTHVFLSIGFIGAMIWIITIYLVHRVHSIKKD